MGYLAHEHTWSGGETGVSLDLLTQHPSFPHLPPRPQEPTLSSRTRGLAPGGWGGPAMAMANSGHRREVVLGSPAFSPREWPWPALVPQLPSNLQSPRVTLASCLEGLDKPH